MSSESIAEALSRLSVNLDEARAAMATGQQWNAFITYLMIEIYQQADVLGNRWKEENGHAFNLFSQEIGTNPEPYTVDDYDYLALTIEQTYNAAHKKSAADSALDIIKYAALAIAIFNVEEFDAVGFAAIAMLVQFYLEPVDKFPDYLKGHSRGILFATNTEPLPAIELAAAMKPAYEGREAAGSIAAIDRGVFVGMRMLLGGLKPGEAIDGLVFQWNGPEDERNRPLCHVQANRFYNMEMASVMANGYGTSVWDDMGGPGCRHVWVKEKLSQVRAEGLGSFIVNPERYRAEPVATSGKFPPAVAAMPIDPTGGGHGETV